ncbi:MAG: ABC transporter substrate-binding protein [Actinomycetota bacterium]|nr:ABC transporter substrate-binding protein [Actinomycetota bacterium]
MRWTKVAALATVGAFSLAACGGSPGGNASKATGSSSTAKASGGNVAFDATAKGPAPDIAGAKKGGTLTAYESTPPAANGFDPSANYYSDTAAILSQLVTRSLTTYRVQDGKSVLVPDLATNLGTTSADGLTWTFKLKPGQKYSNGKPIMAADYVYAVKRSFAQGSVAASGPTYVETYLKGGDTYKGPFTGPQNFQGVTAPDNSTVVFHLAKKWPTLPYYVSFSQVSPIPQALDTKAQYGNNPVATGPYMFDKYTSGSELTLKKNPYWVATSDPARHQYVNAYDFKFTATDATNQAAVLGSNGAYATSINFSAGGVDVTQLAKVQGNNKSQLVTGGSPCEYFANMDTRKIPLAVRKAYAVAYPFDQMRKAAGETTLSFKPATTLAPPQLPGFKSYGVGLPGLTGQGNGDPVKAKAMLKAAGKLGFQITYYTSTDNPKAVASSGAKAAALTTAGFTVKPVGVSKTQLRTLLSKANAPVNTGQGPAGWCYDWPSGDSVYPPIFGSAAVASGTAVGDLQNKALDAQMAKISGMPIAQAAAAWSALDKQILTQDLPAVPTDYIQTNFVIGKQVHNAVVDANRGEPDFSQMWVG